MDISPTSLGAAVDVTDPALAIAVEAIADAIARDEHTVLDHLLRLAEARRVRDAAKARVERPGVDLIRDQVLEAAEQEVDATRDLIVARLVDDEGVPVTVPVVLPGSACRKAGRALVAAADAVESRWHQNVARFPQQQDRRAS